MMHFTFTKLITMRGEGREKQVEKSILPPVSHKPQGFGIQVQHVTMSILSTISCEISLVFGENVFHCLLVLHADFTHRCQTMFKFKQVFLCHLSHFPPKVCTGIPLYRTRPTTQLVMCL